MQRTHAAREQLLGPHKLDDAEDDGEVAEEAIHQHEGARRVPTSPTNLADSERLGESRTVSRPWSTYVLEGWSETQPRHN